MSAEPGYLLEALDIVKRFGEFAANDRISLRLRPGNIHALLGENGAGKSTLVKIIYGALQPTSGELRFQGEPVVVKDPAAARRLGIGMVFQNYAVWPHMKVFNNVVYGLKLKKMSKQSIKEKGQEVLKLVGLDGLEDRYPSQLSGGQQQRVALARALVGNPKVLLLDEPLSNLDAKLREELRFEIKSLVRRMGITSVYVTHDQAEAMVISDRIAVMESGNVVQIGTAQEIYAKPANRFVADFIGTMNFMPGEVVEVLPNAAGVHVRPAFSDKVLCTVSGNTTTSAGAKVYASIRPEDVEIFTDPPQARENLFKGTIAHKAYLGNFLYFFVSVNDTMIRVQVPHHLPQEEGQDLYLYLNPQKCMLLL